MKKHIVEFIDENSIIVDGKLKHPDEAYEINGFCPAFMYGHSGYAAKAMAYTILLAISNKDFADKNYMKLVERVISKATKDEIIFSYYGEMFFIEKEL